jgi:hypothetical protein
MHEKGLESCHLRTLKGSGNYLKNQVRKNLAKTVLGLIFFFLIFAAASLHILHSLKLAMVDEAGLLVSLIPLVASYFYLRRYRIYGGGLEGEEQVVKLLRSKLSDDYFLINDLCLRNGVGDIDHVVLGPNGVFVLETKNWSGKITCDGDEWSRVGKKNFKGSPSRQVKRNVSQIKHLIDSSQTFGTMGIRVEGILVFTNSRSDLHLNNPTVEIVRLPQLPQHITKNANSNHYSDQLLEEIGKEILKQKR